MTPFSPSTPPIHTHRLCINCVHALLRNDSSILCRQFGSIDVVTGVVRYHACSVLRSDGDDGPCGLDAKYFVRRIPFNGSSV